MSFKIGRLFGIPIYVHWLLVFMIVLRVLQSTRAGPEAVRWALVVSGFVFIVILAHEFGHCLAGRRVGGSADRILMWPLGGLAYVLAPRQPRAELIVAVGGPLVNVILLAVFLPILMYRGEAPASWLLEWGKIQSWPGALSAVNLDLLLFNLIPAIPLDGGRILKCILWFRIGEHRATLLSVYVGWVFGALMVLLGLIGLELLMVCLGIWVMAQGENQRRQLMDRSEGFVPEFRLDTAPWHAPVTGWWTERRQRRERLRRERAARERIERERRVDELLEKVSRTGMAGLSAQERKFLEKASTHYRDRDAH
ncbi:MAG: site-2 protease family protein [Planctomycetota bacterium]